MDFSKPFVERAKIKLGSYNKVAIAAGCTRQHIGRVKAGDTGIGPYYARILAEKIGENPDKAERLALAEGARSHKERDYWKKLAGLAAGVILSFSILTVSPLSSNAYADVVFNPSIHYASVNL